MQYEVVKVGYADSGIKLSVIIRMAIYTCCEKCRVYTLASEMQPLRNVLPHKVNEPGNFFSWSESLQPPPPHLTMANDLQLVQVFNDCTFNPPTIQNLRMVFRDWQQKYVILPRQRFAWMD